MMSKIIIWNCNGAASPSFLHTINDIIRFHEPDTLRLLEPRTNGAQADSICRKLGFDTWVRVEAYGYSGGIWVFWKDSLKVDVLLPHPQFVHL